MKIAVASRSQGQRQFVGLMKHCVLSQAATDIRKEVNVLDNQTTGKAVDALLNYETVALFNNQVMVPWCSVRGEAVHI